MDIKGIFSSKWVKWGFYALLIALIGYAAYVTYERKKKRADFVANILSAPDTDEYKTEIKRQAAETGETLERRAQINAEYLFPINPFKKARG